MTMLSKRARGRLAFRAAALGLTVALAIPLTTVPADARAGGGFSLGSRGTRTFSTPSFTPTAPRPAQPIQRSDTPSPSLGGGLAGAAQPRRFGFGGGLAAGLLTAGVLGMVMGHGFFGGLGDIASVFGLLFQLALIGGLAWLALRFFRARFGTPAYAGYPGISPRAFGGVGSGPAAPAAMPVQIGPQDYAAFEQALAAIQDAYGREDVGALARLATPEMARNFASDIEANRARGMRNAVSNARLLQGDLAEAWREGASEYATVAMRFSVRDILVDRASGRVVSGDASGDDEVKELWTFRRDGSGPWRLSAIQQAG